MELKSLFAGSQLSVFVREMSSADGGMSCGKVRGCRRKLCGLGSEFQQPRVFRTS